MKITKGIFNYILLSIMTINIVLMITINIAKYVLSENDLIFRNWVDIIQLRNKWCLIFTFIAFLMAWFLKNIKSMLNKILLIVVSTIFIVILIGISILDVGFSKTDEFRVNKNGQEVIGETSSFLGTTWIDFYISVNKWVMKVSMIPQERYEHGENPYRN